MKRKSIDIFLWVIILCGAVLRLLQLGTPALTEAESNLAISALRVMETTSPVISAVYQNASGALFFVLSDTNFLARLPVAAAGVFLIFAPFLFVDQIGKGRALVWSFLIAVSPLAAASARQINTMTLVLALAVIAIWAVLNEKKFAAGAIFGMLVLAGPEFWLFFAIAFAIWFLDRGKILSTGFREKVKKLFTDRDDRIIFWVGLALSALIFGAGFLQNPSGLGSFVNSAVMFFSSYTKITPLGLIINAAAIFIYEPLLVLTVALSIFDRSKKSWSMDRAIFLTIVWFVLVGRTEYLLGLSAVTFGLAFAASEKLNELADAEMEFPKESALMAVFALVVFIFAGFNLLSSLTIGLPMDQVTARIVISVFSILLLALSAGLVSAGWTPHIAASGTVIGLLVFTGLVNTATLSRASGLYARPTQELWQLTDPAINASAITDPIDRVNQWNDRGAMDTKIEIVGTRSDALLWALRGHDVREIADMKLSNGGTPFVVTVKDIDLDLLQGDYRGQNSVWTTTAAIASFQPMTLARWLVFRDVPINKHSLILWTNSDQFVDLQNQTAE